MKKFRIKKVKIPTFDPWSSDPDQGYVEAGAFDYYTAYQGQMRIFPFIWVTIREFAFENENNSLWCANNLLADIQRF